MLQANIQPLRNGLIAKPAGIIKHLDNACNNTNGYHLAQVLCKSCYIAGDQMLHQLYRIAISKRLNALKPELRLWVKEQMENQDALVEFCGSNGKRNMKLFYREVSVIVSHIGSLSGSYRTSSLDIIDDLVHRKFLNQKAGHNLKYAVAVASEVRLRLYDTAGGQIAEGEIAHKLDIDNSSNSIEDCVGKESIFDFFDVFYAFWSELHSVIILGNPLEFLSKSCMRYSGQHIQRAINGALYPEGLDGIGSVSGTSIEKNQRRGILYFSMTLLID